MVRRYRNKLVVMCFNSKPVDLSTFCRLNGKMMTGFCKSNHCNMYIKRVGEEFYHIDEEYNGELIWYKTIKSDGGLYGVDAHMKESFEKVDNLDLTN